jgi:hypothetical protein
MTPRPHIALLLVLLGSACSQIFPATKNEPAVTSLQPRVQKTGARRRAGSDVTVPKGVDARTVISALVPCDPADSAAVKPRIVTDCQHIDPTGDILRPQVDSVTRKAP